MPLHCRSVIISAEYNVMVGHRPFSDQVMLLTDRFRQWSAICAINFFCSCNSLLLVFIICIIIVLYHTFHCQRYSITSLRWSTNLIRMHKVTSCLPPLIDCGLQLMLRGSKRRFPGEEKKVQCVMYTMFTEWKYDIRYKMALSCLDSVERAWKWSGNQWSACKASFNPSKTVAS